jgi:hypothetical protein
VTFCSRSKPNQNNQIRRFLNVSDEQWPGVGRVVCRRAEPSRAAAPEAERPAQR